MPLLFLAAFYLIGVLIGILLVFFLLTWFPVDREGSWGWVLRGMAAVYFAFLVYPYVFSGGTVACLFLMVYPSLPVRLRLRILRWFHAVVDPLLRPIDALIPPIGGLSLSGLILLILLQYVQSVFAHAAVSTLR